MTFYGENESGRFELPAAISVEINCELGVPADDMTVTFPGALPTLFRIYAQENGEEVFCGVADEQIETRGNDGCKTTVCARSLAALALDSECEAGEYVSPSLSVMYLKHLLPFGITPDSELPNVSGSSMTVARGQSHYFAVKKFCSIFMETQPRIDSTGRFRADARKGGEPIVFGRSGIGFSRLVVRKRRCGLISKVFVTTDGKPVTVSDKEAILNGVVRERRISLLDSRTGTLSDADEIIRKGRASAFEAELLCPDFLGDIVGSSAAVKGGGLDGMKLVIKRTKFTAGGSSPQTRVTLALEEVL